MSAPPRKPCRRQTFALEIDPDQILLDVGDYDYDYDDDVGTTLPHPDNEAPRHSNSYNNNDRLSRPPRQPSRRSTVRVGLDPDQLEAFEEWRAKHAALLQDDSVVDVEFSADDLSSSVMDMTIDSTILSWVDNTHGPNVTSSSANNSNSSSAPPRQPRRRSTLIVTLGQPPQGLYKLDGGDDTTGYDEDGLDDNMSSSFNYGSAARPHLYSSHDSAQGASFSEDSHATSVLVELFCKKVLEEQRKHPPSSKPSSSRRGSARRAARPSPRASLRLRGPVRHLRQLMLPELERIESVGTVLDDDDDDNDGTPENSTRVKSTHDLINDDDDPSDSVLASVRSSLARKHDTHPVAPVRALSHQSTGTTAATAASATTAASVPTSTSISSGGGRRDRDRMMPAEPMHPDGGRAASVVASSTTTHIIMADHNPIQPCRRATIVNPSGRDNVASDLPSSNPAGIVVNNPIPVVAVGKDKVMRESLQTVATEVSWESQDDNDDEYNDQDVEWDACSPHDDVEAEAPEGLHHNPCLRPAAAVRGVR